MKSTKNLGMILLGIWLVLTGLLAVISLPIPFLNIIMAFLAIGAGVLILLGR
jgi:hypothetical protein